jgi:hypothetical protein
MLPLLVRSGTLSFLAEETVFSVFGGADALFGGADGFLSTSTGDDPKESKGSKRGRLARDTFDDPAFASDRDEKTSLTKDKREPVTAICCAGGSV